MLYSGSDQMVSIAASEAKRKSVITLDNRQLVML